MTRDLNIPIGLSWLATTLALACSPAATTPADVTATPDTVADADTSNADADDGDGDGEADTPPPDSADAPEAEVAAPGTSTDEQLAAFWDANGGRDLFPPSYVDGVEALLHAEDEVVAGDYAAARARIDAIFATYPLSDPVWWSGIGQDLHGLNGTNVGTPVAYYGLRMLDEIADVGLGRPRTPSEPITLTVVLARCAEGERPTDASLTEGETVTLSLDPAIEADDHRIVRQSLRIFQHYVWAITGGALHLELRFVAAETCVAVSYGASPLRAALDDASEAILQVPPEVAETTDMWWVLYPSNVPSAPRFDGIPFITGGMGGWGSAPVFIIDDLWLVRKPSHLGTGPYSEVERRVYLPQWLQHEFFHHLFRTWPQFGLEASSHQWFDRDSWPDDFEGAWEPDYYAEALHKRLYGAKPSLTEALRTASE